MSGFTQTIHDVQASLPPNTELFAFIKTLKRESGGKIRIFAMSNISHADYQALVASSRPIWEMFKHASTSAAVGMRKPDLRFYKHVIEQTGCNSENTVFLDDKMGNVFSAQTMGMHGVVYEDLTAVRTAVRNLVGDPVHRGLK